MHPPIVQKVDAGALYRGAEGYNCAQAVLAAVVGPNAVDRACLAKFAGYGSGHAPGGECGALFAAKALLNDADAQQRVEEAFLEVASSTKCRDIRARRTIACRRCVQTAALAALAALASNSAGATRTSSCCGT